MEFIRRKLTKFITIHNGSSYIISRSSIKIIARKIYSGRIAIIKLFWWVRDQWRSEFIYKSHSFSPNSSSLADLTTPLYSTSWKWNSLKEVHKLYIVNKSNMNISTTSIYHVIILYQFFQFHVIDIIKESYSFRL